MLRRKQDIRSNDDWLTAYDTCCDAVSREQSDRLAQDTADRIESVMRAHSKPASGWCAGKDSIVLEHLLCRFGFEHEPIMWRGVNEYPAMAKWIDGNAPDNLRCSIVGKFSLEFLEAHPDYLFCQGDTRNKWMAEKWRRQRADMESGGYDLLILGRRRKDGNQCGKAENAYVADRGGFDAFSPLADWTHEELLAYIRWNGIELPPFYSWPNGFLYGSVAMGEWTERPAMGRPESAVWDEIMRIDAEIVKGAANTLTAARRYLDSIGAEG